MYFSNLLLAASAASIFTKSPSLNTFLRSRSICSAMYIVHLLPQKPRQSPHRVLWKDSSWNFKWVLDKNLFGHFLHSIRWGCFTWFSSLSSGVRRPNGLNMSRHWLQLLPFISLWTQFSLLKSLFRIASRNCSRTFHKYTFWCSQSGCSCTFHKHTFDVSGPNVEMILNGVRFCYGI